MPAKKRVAESESEDEDVSLIRGVRPAKPASSLIVPGQAAGEEA